MAAEETPAGALQAESGPSTVFLSYAREDSKWRDMALRPLRALETNGKFVVWHDGKIEAGGPWKRQIEEEIDEADAAILLITDNFLGSKFITKREVPPILKRAKRHGMPIFPLICEPCVWQEIGWLASMQVRPDGGRPVVKGSPLDQQYDFRDLALEVLKRLRPFEEAGAPPQPRPAPIPRRRTGRQRAVAVSVVNLQSGLRHWRRWLERLQDAQSYFRFRPSFQRVPRRALEELEGSRQLKLYRLPEEFQSRMIRASDTLAVGLSGHMLAFEQENFLYYNYLGARSSADQRIAFVSVAGYLEHAATAGVSARAAFAYALASRLLRQLGDLEFHKPVIGCPMDFAEEHADIALGMRKGELCQSCEAALKRNKTPLFEAIGALLAYGR